MDNKIENLKIGDGITYVMYSDRKAMTILEKTERKIVAALDDQELDENWKPDMVPGGFSAHCQNQNSQKWICKTNVENVKLIFTRRKNGKWVEKSQKMNGYHIVCGRFPFYDFNF